MVASRVHAIGSIIRTSFWWVVPPLALAIVIGATVNTRLLPALFIYNAINLAGVWHYCDRHGPRKLGRQRVMKLLAIPMLPAGVLGAFGGDGGLSPSELAGTGSDDPDVRQGAATAAASSPALKLPSSS